MVFPASAVAGAPPEAAGMHRVRAGYERGPDYVGASDPHVRPLADSRECLHLGSLADFRNQGFGIPHARDSEGRVVRFQRIERVAGD